MSTRCERAGGKAEVAGRGSHVEVLEKHIAAVPQDRLEGLARIREIVLVVPRP